jgi:metal-responsive CopG/Arc/MetJ family transcriptional regulator
MDTMVKTRVILEDELYKKLVQEAIEKYGSTRKLSKLINQKLKQGNVLQAEDEKRMRIKLGRKLTKELEEAIERTWSETTRWISGY